MDVSQSVARLLLLLLLLDRELLWGYRGIRVGEDDDIQRGYSVSKCGMISTRSALICSYVCTSRGRSFVRSFF